MSTMHELRKAAINRHRKRMFGSSSLTAYKTTPEAGDALVTTLASDWRAFRSRGTTDGGGSVDAWQFEIVASSDWATSQANFRTFSVFKIGDRRWKITKTQEPIGESLVWKFRATTQK